MLAVESIYGQIDFERIAQSRREVDRLARHVDVPLITFDESTRSGLGLVDELAAALDNDEEWQVGTASHAGAAR